MRTPNLWAVRNQYHAHTVGTLGTRQSLQTKGWVAALLVLVLAFAALGAMSHQTHPSAQYFAEGDSPKVGAGG